MAGPAFDITHPLYRAAVAPLAPGIQDVFGALLPPDADLVVAPPESRLAAPQEYAGALVALPFRVQGEWSLEGLFILHGPAVPVLVGSLLGGGDPPTTVDELHVPVLRESLAAALGRWASALQEQYGARFETALDSPLNPLTPAEVLERGPVAGQAQVVAEEFALAFRGEAGIAALLLPPAALDLLVTHHPAYQPAEVPVMDVPAPPAPDPVAVSRPQFQQLEPRDAPSGEPRRIDLLLDVPLSVAVELGRQDLSIKEILELSPGAIIELNRLAGEPLDLLINGQLFAKGEVVVIDENFGIRITSIISPEERLQSLR